MTVLISFATMPESWVSWYFRREFLKKSFFVVVLGLNTDVVSCVDVELVVASIVHLIAWHVFRR